MTVRFVPDRGISSAQPVWSPIRTLPSGELRVGCHAPRITRRLPAPLRAYGQIHINGPNRTIPIDNIDGIIPGVGSIFDRFLVLM